MAFSAHARRWLQAALLPGVLQDVLKDYKFTRLARHNHFYQMPIFVTHLQLTPQVR